MSLIPMWIAWGKGRGGERGKKFHGSSRMTAARSSLRRHVSSLLFLFFAFLTHKEMRIHKEKALLFTVFRRGLAPIGQARAY